jgi:hypothetical protein
MVARSAIRITMGACWLAFSVWPCLALCETTVPAIGAEDLGVAQVRSSAAQGRFGLLDLRADGVDLSPVRLLRRLGQSATHL